jgi:predicted nicotinamide N-methyase
MNSPLITMLTTTMMIIKKWFIIHLLPIICTGFTIDSPFIISLKHDGAGQENPRIRKLDGKIRISSRKVPIGTNEIKDVTVWELEKPYNLMEKGYSTPIDSSEQEVEKKKIGDPFGVIMWPGSILASRELVRHGHNVSGSTVLVLGAGTGVEVQCAALLGASKVIALDISSLTLKLLQFGAKEAGVGDIVEPVLFDLYSNEALPQCDILVAADVLYSPDLAQQVGKKVVEVLEWEKPPCLIVTDSQRFHGTDFLQDVNDRFQDRSPLEWQYYELQNIKGSGVMIDADQIYDSIVRMVSVGWE